MAEPQRPTGTTQDSKSLSVLVRELRELIVAYAKQETLDPLKALVRFVAYGVGGAVCFGLGAVLIGVGALRAIRTETHDHLEGDWSWVPYLAVVVLCLIFAGLAASRIGKTPRGQAPPEPGGPARPEPRGQAQADARGPARGGTR